MGNFLLNSLIASVVLTLLINIVPRFFPNTTRKVERSIHDKLEQTLDEQERGDGPKVKVFFPWKAMLIFSLVLTVLVNLVGYFAR